MKSISKLSSVRDQIGKGKSVKGYCPFIRNPIPLDADKKPLFEVWKGVIFDDEHFDNAAYIGIVPADLDLICIDLDGSSAKRNRNKLIERMAEQEIYPVVSVPSRSGWHLYYNCDRSYKTMAHKYGGEVISGSNYVVVWHLKRFVKQFRENRLFCPSIDNAALQSIATVPTGAKLLRNSAISPKMTLEQAQTAKRRESAKMGMIRAGFEQSNESIALLENPDGIQSRNCDVFHSLMSFAGSYQHRNTDLCAVAHDLNTQAGRKHGHKLPINELIGIVHSVEQYRETWKAAPSKHYFACGQTSTAGTSQHAREQQERSAQQRRNNNRVRDKWIALFRSEGFTYRQIVEKLDLFANAIKAQTERTITKELNQQGITNGKAIRLILNHRLKNVKFKLSLAAVYQVCCRNLQATCTSNKQRIQFVYLCSKRNKHRITAK